MWRFFFSVTVLFAVLTTCGLGGDGAAPPKPTEPKDKDPVIRLARSMKEQVEKQDDALLKVSQRLSKAIDAYEPGPLSLPQEREALEAFKQYVTGHLENGQKLVAILEEWAKAGNALSGTLAKSPAYYREAARLHREWAQAARFDFNKELHEDTAAMFDGLARAAERRAKELNLVNGEQDSLTDFLKENNLALSQIRDSLGAVPRSSAEAKAGYEELLQKLAKHRKHSDELRKNIKKFKEKLDGGSAERAGTKAARDG